MLFSNPFNFHSPRKKKCTQTSLRVKRRIPNAIPLSPNTKTQYYYKTHQSRTVSIPSHQRGGKIHVGPDENESYVTRIDTTNLGPRRHSRRLRDDEDIDDEESGRSELKPFFRTG